MVVCGVYDPKSLSMGQKPHPALQFSRAGCGFHPAELKLKYFQ
jgi:hypothetical protein